MRIPIPPDRIYVPLLHRLHQLRLRLESYPLLSFLSYPTSTRVAAMAARYTAYTP